ncbi:MAG: hypothetical protein AAB316_15360, partial [Bacteroidota bacterium]
MRFWLLFLLLNFLLFVPAWLFHFDGSAWFPACGFFYRENLDAFRFSADFMVLTGALFFFPGNKTYSRIAGAALTISYLLLFSYAIFNAFYQRFYAETPHFYSELVMAKEALPIMWLNIGREARLTNHLLVFGAALLAIGGVVFLLKKMKVAVGKCQRPVSTLSADRSGLLATRWGMAGLLAAALFSHFFIEKKDTRQERLEFQWIAKQVIKSCRFEEPGRFKQLPAPLPHQAFLEKELPAKPDIYFIAVEAYGAVASLAPELAGDFQILAGKLERQLDSAGWHSASTYSCSPIIGGRSWLGFTTALTGMHLGNQAHYNNLFKCNPDFPHLVRMLNSNGYFTARLSTLRNSPLADSILPTKELNRFWEFDRFVQFSDIPYRGFQYDLYGGIPDQYSFGFVRDSVLAQVRQPRFLFFITMSSHYPWYEPPPVVGDWRQLDGIQKKDKPEK